MPPWGVVIAFIVAAMCTRWSEAAYDGVKLSIVAQRGHIAVGGICLIICLLSWYVPRLHSQTPAVFNDGEVMHLSVAGFPGLSRCCGDSSRRSPFTFDMK